MNTDKLYAIVVLSLAAIMVAVVIALLVGLFTPSVDNDKVFQIIGPAFSMVVGAFVGILGSRYKNGPPANEK